MNFSLNVSGEYVDALYRVWKSDPGRVPRDWQIFFEGFELAASPEAEAQGICDKAHVLKQTRVEELVYRYRDLGHLLACLDPLADCPISHPLLDLEAFGLVEADLDALFYTPHIVGLSQAPLREIVQMLRETYCRTIGVEYMHLQDPDERRWLQGRMEPVRNRPELSREARLRILRKLCEATLFEQFLHTRYVGQKRFSVEGAEVVIAMLDALVQEVAERGCREIALGMAHRGRLNVQVNVLQRPYEGIFCEFENNFDPHSIYGAGDVKYHTGYLADIKTASGQDLRVLMATNPSHLEAVDPVLEGIARARQELGKDGGPASVLPLLIHGDAAFAGQGVVFETLNLSQLEGYATGGTVHIVINNQIGFTTVPEDARSTRYSTDIAKILMAPVFHVHGEDPDAAVHVMKLASDYRFKYGKDVVIDLVCYRRYGHNEGDEPYYTQPRMYERIKNRPPLYQLFAERLIESGVLSSEEFEAMKSEISASFEPGYRSAHEKSCTPHVMRFFESWEGIRKDYSHDPVPTGVAENRIEFIAKRCAELPQGFSVHPRLGRILKRRLEAVEKGEGIDWSTAEMLALGSLLLEGTRIRMSGQDTRRGTFSQRHSVLVDTVTGEHFTPLAHLAPNQAPLHIYDSMLSENAVLGFDYGYSLVSPDVLVLWEAQFGDFANNAQVIIDQFISSAQAKWQRLSGLVLLLPHGYEGQGPEHSSARLERYLQLCAEDNMQVCNVTTPAQYFHLLRRQVKSAFRKPLVLMTPKSLLRHPRAVSTRSELASGSFREVLADPAQNEKATRVLLCSGKVYYDLLERREALQAMDHAILRLEQFYPFPEQQLRELLLRYGGAQEWYWVQEEPRNMGGWSFVAPQLEPLIGKSPGYIGRREAASPATGYREVYNKTQSAIVEEAIRQQMHS
jgi:2-oxoglutarate dehydrogenase E1 component